ncbi:2-oxoacid:ferredoxin oxidoreductase subunit alpha [Helicobacter winghamensis]|uniref:2-ketoisovalerate ferredoxin oxidoreductase n=1 Tax=Helicobacter winghamensis TaxID=157268 RepID=A0A2N3PJB3_9HELI|nr:2-oxoacid:ferredoxin oxidoreductase subunit alpha [Helicobacter winghamensis]EEO25402.1 pyruvate flavodoxin oxidoreductase subunit alpha [Helicobacter winghamensis ATCC BAA-430]PKT78164.1 2-ketoisovalerate ferredoxin oxidoreductase [Helicobacter winghamensis]PKT78432.1 2-ketoisovalerate ferredoxin oxidoreductase [Helicobacter winghamensis]PKT78693.1 2-ketoisovalerate ferredoxin oxidoreductase [Helicobacter winghamensis]PKT80463.1 2-ketoisovalerate ferredoxin oxidoreductase [Helicobacter win
MAEVYELQDVEVWDGNMAASHAMRQAQIDVVSAYPITPSTPIVQNYATFLSNGYIDGEFVMVESEHAAMSGCVGAAAAGGRVATATSSQGFALMVEVLYQASGMRLPIVLNVVNRALASPLNVNGDHSDMYLGRDAGWINLCTYNPQEAYDFNLMAFKIAEDYEVRLPVMVHQDGFICSHTAQSVRPLSDEVAYKFIGDYKPKNAMLDFERPATYGSQTEEDWHFEHKAQLHNAIMQSKLVIEHTFEEFAKLTGRKYNIVETYDMEDAEVAIVALGTTVESARVAVKEARKNGIKAGVVSIRVLRPFPYQEFCVALQGVKAVAFLDRSLPAGAMGMLFNEGVAALYSGANKPVASNYIYGLGGRDLTQSHLQEIIKELQENARVGKLTHPAQQFIGLRGPKLGFN